MTKTPKPRAAANPDESPRYEERIVLFLDFLGFKELVDRSSREDGFLKRLLAAMNIVGELGADNKGFLASQEITQFSDSIVVSYRVTERSAVFWLVSEIAIMVVRLAERGFLVRGGVTTGLLHHSGRHVVGPAMNEAYRLESKVAKYPRVIIDPAVLALARQARDPNHTAREEEDYARSFLTEDSDGHLFFDYVSWQSVVDVVGGDNAGYGIYLGRLGNLIRDGLRDDEPSVQEKYIWLRRRYVAAIKQVRDLPPDHPYRKANASLCEEIGRLSTWKMDATLAKAAVKKAKAAITTPKRKPKLKRAKK